MWNVILRKIDLGFVLFWLISISKSQVGHLLIFSVLFRCIIVIIPGYKKNFNFESAYHMNFIIHQMGKNIFRRILKILFQLEVMCDLRITYYNISRKNGLSVTIKLLNNFDKYI